MKKLFIKIKFFLKFGHPLSHIYGKPMSTDEWNYMQKQREKSNETFFLYSIPLTVRDVNIRVRCFKKDDGQYLNLDNDNHYENCHCILTIIGGYFSKEVTNELIDELKKQVKR